MTVRVEKSFLFHVRTRESHDHVAPAGTALLLMQVETANKEKTATQIMAITEVTAICPGERPCQQPSVFSKSCASRVASPFDECLKNSLPSGQKSGDRDIQTKQNLVSLCRSLIYDVLGSFNLNGSSGCLGRQTIPAQLPASWLRDLIIPNSSKPGRLPDDL
jgi:hypothetical protein